MLIRSEWQRSAANSIPKRPRLDALANICLLAVFILLCTACSRQTPADAPQRILYLAPDDAGTLQLFVVDQDGSGTEQLTSAEFGIFGFSPSPNGERIALAYNSSPSTTDLWLIERNGDQFSAAAPLLTCEPFVCQSPNWANDNRRLIYERRTFTGDNPTLWWLDAVTGDTVSVFTDGSIRGYYPRLSPDNSQLGFVYIPAPGEQVSLPPGHTLDDGHNHSLAATQQVAIFDFSSGERTLIPNLMNSQVRWHPDSEVDTLLFTDMQFFGERFGLHLFSADVETGNVRDITDGRLLEDASPNWSPDGQQIAFTRKEANTAMGRQLWIMQADGSNTRALSSNANLHHGEPLWDAGGSQLLYQRFDTSASNAVPSVYVYDLSSSIERQLVPHGLRPKWLP